MVVLKRPSRDWSVAPRTSDLLARQDGGVAGAIYLRHLDVGVPGTQALETLRTRYSSDAVTRPLCPQIPSRRHVRIETTLPAPQRAVHKARHFLALPIQTHFPHVFLKASLALSPSRTAIAACLFRASAQRSLYGFNAMQTLSGIAFNEPP